ncbi:hypothetical protein L9F63_014738, partial [Diploptera punctata]
GRTGGRGHHHSNSGPLADDDTAGPVFIKEPPNRVDFSNTTGAEVECSARGNPVPEIIWVRADGTAVGDVPGLRQVLPNGNLAFPAFRAEDYRQEVHAQVYVCLARNSVGSIHSRDVNVRAVVQQFYDTDVNKEYAIRGNSAVLKCQVPSFVADFVSVVSWHTDQGDEFYPSTSDYDGKYLVLPSGELHIRDVGPEDGYKSYQCRTKHRLTGETRLSATKGRLVITEPVGSSIPKFPSVLKSQGLEVKLSESYTLLCPAQGFPVPSYRTSWKFSSKISLCDESTRIYSVLLRIRKPVGSSIPKFPSVIKVQGVNTKINQGYALICPAQGFPVPVYKHKDILYQVLEPVSSTVPRIPSKEKFDMIERPFGKTFALLCQAQGHPVPSFSCHTQISWSLVIKFTASTIQCHRFSRVCTNATIIATSSNSTIAFMISRFQGLGDPILSTLLMTDVMSIGDIIYCELILLFLLSGVFLQHLKSDKPVGAKAPTFSSDLKSGSYMRRAGQGFGLLCQAQAFPVPHLVNHFRSTGVNKDLNQLVERLPLFLFGLLCRAQGFPVPAYRTSRVKVLRCFVELRVSQSQHLEPVGAKAPTVSGDVKGIILVKHKDQSFGLLCRAQGFPVPAFRLNCNQLVQKHRHSLVAMLKVFQSQHLDQLVKDLPSFVRLRVSPFQHF